MSTFVFPPTSFLPQNPVPQHVVTDADIDPVLLALQPRQPHPLPPAPLPHIDPLFVALQSQQPLSLPLPLPPPPCLPIPRGNGTIAQHSLLAQKQVTQTMSQLSTTRQSASNEEDQSSPPPETNPASASATNHSWAGRNPNRPIITPQPRVGKLTAAQKASRAIARGQKKASMKNLDDDIKACAEDQNRKITELAAKHNTTVEKIKRQLGVHTHYKKSRQPALHNALLHAQAERVNRGMTSNLLIHEKRILIYFIQIFWWARKPHFQSCSQ